MSARRRAKRDPRTEELRALGRRLRKEGRMTAAEWLRESAPIYRRWYAQARDGRARGV
jgi:hypothetical protein